MSAAGLEVRCRCDHVRFLHVHSALELLKPRRLSVDQRDDLSVEDEALASSLPQSCSSASTISGNCVALSLPLRVMSFTSPGVAKASTRTPSYFGSNVQPSPGISLPMLRVHRLEARERSREIAAALLRVLCLRLSCSLFVSRALRSVAVARRALSGGDLFHCAAGIDRSHVVGDDVFVAREFVAMLDEAATGASTMTIRRARTSCERARRIRAFARRGK